MHCNKRLSCATASCGPCPARSSSSTTSQTTSTQLPATPYTRRRCTSCSRSPALWSPSASLISPRWERPTATVATSPCCARGARRRDLVWLALLESLVLGVVAGAIGTAVALAAVRLAGTGGGVGSGRVLATFGLCAGLAAAGAAAARVGAGLVAFRGNVAESRRSVRRSGTPLWQRLYLDIVALGVA